jgi:hypothetical protein
VLPRARLAYEACLNAGSTAGACARPPGLLVRLTFQIKPTTGGFAFTY